MTKTPKHNQNSINEAFQGSTVLIFIKIKAVTSALYSAEKTEVILYQKLNQKRLEPVCCLCVELPLKQCRRYGDRMTRLPAEATRCSQRHPQPPLERRHDLDKCIPVNIAAMPF